MENRIAKFVKINGGKVEPPAPGKWIIHTPEGDVIETNSLILSTREVTVNGIPQVCDEGCCKENMSVICGDWPDKVILEHLDKLTEQVAEAVAERFLNRMFGEDS